MWILERQGDWCRLSPTICIRLGAFLMSGRCRLAPRVAYLSQNKSLASIFIHLYKVPCDREYKRINLIVASEHLLPFQRSEVQELRHPFRLSARWWRSIENSRSSPSFEQPQAPLSHCSERKRDHSFPLILLTLLFWQLQWWGCWWFLFQVGFGRHSGCNCFVHRISALWPLWIKFYATIISAAKMKIMRGKIKDLETCEGKGCLLGEAIGQFACWFRIISLCRIILCKRTNANQENLCHLPKVNLQILCCLDLV